MKTIVTLEFDTPAEAAAFLSGQASGAAAQPVTPPKTTKGSAAPAAAASPDPKASSPKEPDAPSSAGAAADTFTVEQVTKAVLELAAKKGKDAAKEALASIGATRATDADPARYGELMETIQAALA